MYGNGHFPLSLVYLHSGIRLISCTGIKALQGTSFNDSYSIRACSLIDSLIIRACSLISGHIPYSLLYAHFRFYLSLMFSNRLLGFASQ